MARGLICNVSPWILLHVTCDLWNGARGFNFWLFKRLCHRTSDVSSPHLTTERVAYFSTRTWPHGSHAPNTSDLGGLIPGNCSTFWCILRDVHVLGLCTRKRSGARFTFPQVQNGERVRELEGEKWQKP
jgi:hypothetical protein